MNYKITDLTEVTAVSPSGSWMEIVSDGVSKKITPENLVESSELALPLWQQIDALEDAVSLDYEGDQVPVLQGEVARRASLELLFAPFQPVLGFNPEDEANKDTDVTLAANSDVKYPSQKAVRTYIDAEDSNLQSQIDAHTVLIDTSMKKPEAFTPAGSYPTTYGGIAIQAGDTFRLAAGTMGAITVNAEDLLIALIDTPGQTDANWQVIESNRLQATESVTGFAKITTQAIIEDTGTTNDTDIITAKKFWLGITKFLSVAWTFALKITFTTAPRFSSVTASQILEVDGSKDLISVAKGTAYNKDKATSADVDNNKVVMSDDTRLSNARSILAMSWGTGGMINAGVTSYGSFIAGATTFNATEQNREMIVPIGGTVKKFFIRTGTTHSAGGTFVFTVRINGADTSIVITLAASEVAGVYGETHGGGSLHTAAINAGDRICFKGVNNGAGSSANVIGVALYIE